MSHTLSIVIVETTYVAGTFYVSRDGSIIMFNRTVIVEREIFICETAPKSSSLRTRAAELLHSFATH
jgi:hypothetical protein